MTGVDIVGVDVDARLVSDHLEHVISEHEKHGQSAQEIKVRELGAWSAAHDGCLDLGPGGIGAYPGDPDLAPPR